MGQDVQNLDSWRPFHKKLCEGCWSACCTLPVEMSAQDLIRLELATEDEVSFSLEAVADRLLEKKIIQGFSAKKQIFVLSQVAGRDCIYLDKNRRCKVYEKRPRVCRDFPVKVGPKTGHCPERRK